MEAIRNRYLRPLLTILTLAPRAGWLIGHSRRFHRGAESADVFAAAVVHAVRRKSSDTIMISLCTSYAIWLVQRHNFVEAKFIFDAIDEKRDLVDELMTDFSPQMPNWQLHYATCALQLKDLERAEVLTDNHVRTHEGPPSAFVQSFVLSLARGNISAAESALSKFNYDTDYSTFFKWLEPVVPPLISDRVDAGLVLLDRASGTLSEGYLSNPVLLERLRTLLNTKRTSGTAE